LRPWRDEHPQQLDAVPVGKVQIHHDQRRPERVDERQEIGCRARARDRVVELMRRRRDEVDDSGLVVHDQEAVDVVTHACGASTKVVS
jgi:hypothetical protein